MSYASTRTRSADRRSRGLRRALSAAVLVPAALAMGVASANGAVSGTVFEDFNSNGTQDAGGPAAAVDTGAAGITVTALGDDGITYGPVVTGANGSYSIPVPAGVTARVVFSGLPTGFTSGFAGADSGTSTQFVTADATDVDYGINVPGNFCQDNPLLVTTCFAFGPTGAAANVGDPAIVGFPYGVPNQGDLANESGKVVLATIDQVGSTYGLAVDRNNGDYYAGAFMKRHSAFGDTPGTIYKVPNTGGTSYGAPAVWATIPNAGADTHTQSANGNDWILDSVAAFDAVGKNGLGDIDINDDGSELYVVNLNDRKLYTVATASGTPNAGVAIPAPAGVPAGDWRPFAVGYNKADGLVYVGGVNSAQSTQNAANLAAHVMTYDPATGAFASSPVLSAPLDFGRKCTRSAGNDLGFDDITNVASVECGNAEDRAEWLPWIDETQLPNDGTSVFPQPWLTDIDFDRGEIILGVRDRIGDQLGNNAYGPAYPADQSLYATQPAGAIYRAFPNGAGFTLEDNAADPAGVATGGAGSDEGPGGGSWYYGDDHFYHDHVGLGSVVQVPGFADTPMTAQDPIYDPQGYETFDGGLIWLGNKASADPGNRTKEYRIFDGENDSVDTFGKANGLGDLEAFCEIAPLQIGNRIWIDSDRDGVQDPGEAPVAGLTVELLDANSNVIGTTTTDADGLYYFDASNVPGGLTPDTAYMISVPAGQAPLASYVLTSANQGGDDELDSDATLVNGAAKINLTTGKAGENDHSFDIGYHLPAPEMDILKEVWNPATSTWMDADSDAGTRGDNAGGAAQHLVGETAKYRVTVFNTGQIDLASVNVTDPWCGLNTTFPLVAAGASMSVECTVANVTADHVNTAQASGAQPVDANGNPIGNPLPTLTERAAIEVYRPALDILKEVKDANGNWIDADANAGSRGSNDGIPAELRIGDTAEYRVTVFNTGNVNLANVRVLDPWCQLDETVALLAVGQNQAYTCERPNINGGNDGHVNTAIAEGATPVLPGGRAANPLPRIAEQAQIRVAAKQKPVLRITKKVVKPRITSGKNAVWNVTVRNTGKGTAIKVKVVDTIPSGFALVKSQILVKRNGKNKWVNKGFKVKNGTVIWAVGNMKPGAVKRLRVTMRSFSSTSGNRTNKVTATASNHKPVRAKAKVRIVKPPVKRIIPAVTG